MFETKKSLAATREKSKIVGSEHKEVHQQKQKNLFVQWWESDKELKDCLCWVTSTRMKKTILRSSK
jgi:hypothetical protein